MLEEIKNDQLVLRSNHTSQELRTRLCRMRQEGTLLDVTLKTDDNSNNHSNDRSNNNSSGIKAHRIILCLFSDYFDRMLTSDFAEKSESVVAVGGVDSAALASIVNYFYTGYLRANADNAVSLLGAADLLLLNDAKESLARFLRHIIKVGNCVMFKRVADTYGLSELSAAAHRFICRNFDKLTAAGGRYLAELTLEEMEDILNSDSLCSTMSEELLLEAVVAWAEKDLSNREANLNRLLQKVDFCEIAEEKLSSYTTTMKVVLKSYAATADTSPKRRSKVGNSHKLVLAISYDSKVIECLDTSSMSSGFTILTEVPGLRYGFGGASMATDGKNNIFITGGVGGEGGGIMKAVNRYLEYNVKEDKWSEGPNMIKARKGHPSGVLNGILYVVGGTDEQLPVLTAEYMDLTDGCSCWKELNQLSQWHQGNAIVQLGESRLIVLSSYGNDNDKELHVVNNNSDNSSDNLWLSLAVQENNNRVNRNGIGVAMSPSEILAIGGTAAAAGKEALKTVEVYSSSNSWRKLPDMNVAREGPGAALVDGKVWAVGGRGSGGSVEVMNVATGKWEVIEGLKVKDENEEYFAVVVDRL